MLIFIAWAIDSALTALVLYGIGRVVLPEVGLEVPSYWSLLVACGLWYAYSTVRVLATAAGVTK